MNVGVRSHRARKWVGHQSGLLDLRLRLKRNNLWQSPARKVPNQFFVVTIGMPVRVMTSRPLSFVVLLIVFDASIINALTVALLCSQDVPAGSVPGCDLQVGVPPRRRIGQKTNMQRAVTVWLTATSVQWILLKEFRLSCQASSFRILLVS